MGSQRNIFGHVPWLYDCLPVLGGVFALHIAACSAPDHRIGVARFVDLCGRYSTQTSPDMEHVSTDAVDARLGPYRVGPGDVLQITVTPRDQPSPVPRLVRVGRDGTILLPIVGAVSAADLELQDVEDAIRSAYVPSIYRECGVYVELVSVTTVEVLVTGAVTEPGLVPLRRHGRDLLHAIVGAGGVSDTASGEVTLRRVRDPSRPLTFNLRNPRQLALALAQDDLDNGDMVEVHSAVPNTIFVGGLVNRPMPQSYPPGAPITLLQALAAAGGLRTDVSPREGTLVRRMPDGTDVHVKLNLRRLACGEDPDIDLAGGDIVWVPDTWQTRVQDFINRNIFFRAGISVNYNVTGLEFLNRTSLQRSSLSNTTLQDSFDPLGFLSRNSALQLITNQTRP